MRKLGAMVAGIVLLAGCDRAGRTDSLRPVALPDLARMSPAVAQQIRSAHGALPRDGDSRGDAAGLSEAYGTLGKLLMAAEYYEAAEPSLDNAHVLAPDDPRWTYYLAHVYRHRNQLTQAAEFFERTLRLRPDDVPSLVHLGETHLAAGHPEAAESAFTRAVARDGRLAVAFLGLGRAAMAKADYAAAVGHLERALALESHASTIHHTLAMAYRAAGQPQAAEAHFRRRGDVRPHLPDPLLLEVAGALESAATFELRGTDALNKAEWDAAAFFLRKAVDLDPSSRSARLKLAEALRRNGAVAQALDQYEKASNGAARDDDPRGPGARLGHAMALVSMRRYREALDALADAMRAHPGEPQFSRAFVRLLAAAPDDRVRNPRRALAMTHDLLGEESKDANLVETQAMALAELGRFDEAVALQRSLLAAASQAGYDDLVSALAANLRRYEARQPSRTPWTDATMP